MKKRSLIISILLLTMLSFAVQAQNKTDKTTPPTYAEIAAKLKTGETNVDYKRLRTAFTETKDYSYGGTERAETAKMFKSLSEKNYKEALKQAEKILEKNYVELNAHYVAFSAAKQLKDDKKAEFHRTILVGLMDAIQNGNNGQSAKTPFFPITIDEEYTIMSLLSYKYSSQSLQSLDGHQFDVFDAVDSKTGKNTKLYFNIDIIWKAESAIFGK